MARIPAPFDDRPDPADYDDYDYSRLHDLPDGGLHLRSPVSAPAFGGDDWDLLMTPAPDRLRATTGDEPF